MAGFLALRHLRNELHLTKGRAATNGYMDRGGLASCAEVRKVAEWPREVVTMMTFIDTSNEEDLLTHEVSDEALEAAGAYEVAANFTLAACTNMWYCAA